jgi:hypothetical protein
MTLVEQLSSADALPRIKAGVAVIACLLLYLEWRRPDAIGRRRKRLVALGLAAVALAAYFHFSDLPGTRRYHGWEMFHYYVGAKYAPELGYTRLYQCAAVAEADLGSARQIEPRMLRDLRDDTLVSGQAVLADASRCRSRFTLGRWEAFRSDIAWFRSASGGKQVWEAMQQDHGYNPSPVWTLVGRPLASISPLSHLSLRRIAMLDLALTAAIVGLLWWGFGWRVMAVGVVFWGTQAAAEMPWTGGGFLRMDWLLLCVASIALLRRRHYFWAGAALGYAALIRVFPLLLWSGPLVIGTVAWLRTRRLPPWLWRMVAGGALAAAVLVPASVGVAGPGAWSDFADHTRMHAQTPIANHMSLRTLFAAASDREIARAAAGSSDPWTAARRAELAEHRLLYWIAAAALVAAFVAVVGRLRTPWLGLGLGVALIVALTDPSCYYYVVFLVAAPLCRARRSLEMALVGLAGVGQLVVMRLSVLDDHRYVILAALYVGFVGLLLGVFGRPLSLRALWRRFVHSPTPEAS